MVDTGLNRVEQLEPGLIAYARGGKDIRFNQPSATGSYGEYTRRDAVANALLHRFSPMVFQLEDAARQYRGMTLLELARESLGNTGVNTRGLSRDEVATRALHSTSDFPEILSAVTNKTLLQAYDAYPRTFALFCRQVLATDFKSMHRVQLGEAPQLLEVGESGQFKRGTLGESKESYKVKTYGRVVAITRQVLINDDLDAFTRIPAMYGNSIAQLESDVVWGIMTANPAMADCKAAVSKVLCATWQRCRVHFQRNALAHAGKSGRRVVSAFIATAFAQDRRHTLLPLDDCLYALQPSIPHLTRSALHRCLQRHGISRLPDMEGDKPKRSKFKRYPIGFFHIDIAEVQTAEGKLYLFVGIDRTSKFAVTQRVDKADRKTAWEFLQHMLEAVPYQVHTILTDNGIQFAEQPRNRNTIYSRPMRFDMICEANGIEHRLTKPNHPWTNGQVERMNRTIKEATVKRFHYETHEQLRTHLEDFMAAYNFARRLKTLGGLTPYEYICKIWTSEPDRFILNPIHQMPGLNT